MIKNEKTKEDIGQSTENHRAAVAICDAPIEEIENGIVTLKREKEAYDAEEEERTIQRRLEEERRILEMQMEMKKKKKRRKKKKVFFSSLNDCKFSKTKLPRLVITKFDGTHFDWFTFGDQFESQIGKCDLPKVAKFRKVLKK